MFRKNKNFFNSGRPRGRGLHYSSPNQRGRFPRFPGKNNREWRPPAENIIPLGKLAYCCQGDIVCKAEIENVPYFSAPIYLSNRQQIGKIDEIFGNPKDYSVSIKLDENIKASSFPPGEIFFIDSAKLLPLNRFLFKPKERTTGRGPGPKKWSQKFSGSIKSKNWQKSRSAGSFARK